MLEPGVRAQIVYGVKDPKEAKSRLYYIGWADGSMDPDWVLRPLRFAAGASEIYEYVLLQQPEVRRAAR